MGQAQVQRRLSKVEQLLAQGTPRSEIIELTQLRPRTADDYIRRVRDSWRTDAEESRAGIRDQALSRLITLRDRLVQAGAWGPLVNLEKLILDLEGLRGRPAPDGGTDERATPVQVPALTAGDLRKRAPMLISACVRVALRSDDDQLLKQTRLVLTRSLGFLETGSG